MTPFDRVQFARTLVTSAVALGVTIAVVVGTDEAASTFAMRGARVGAIAPLGASLSALVVSGHLASRGEALALQALGVPPWRVARGAAVAALAVALAGLALLASPWADPASLFPAALPPFDWLVAPDGATASAAGVRVAADGALTVAGGASGPAAAVPGVAAALLAVGPVALAAPAWAVTPMSRAVRVASVLAATTLVVVALHGIAAGRVPAPMSVAAVVPLVAATVRARRG